MFCSQKLIVFLPCALHLLKIDNDEEFDSEPQVFDAGNIKVDCGGWRGWVDLEKVRAALQFSYPEKSQGNIIRSILCHSSQKKSVKKEVTEIAGISLPFSTSCSNSL